MRKVIKQRYHMYFDELELGMTVNTKPAIIEKEKMLAFAREYDCLPADPHSSYRYGLLR